MDMQNDDGSGGEGGKPKNMVPLLVLDPLNLSELLMWGTLALSGIEKHPDEAKVSLMSLAAGHDVSDGDVQFTKQRLVGFLDVLQDLIHEMRTGQAQAELATIDKTQIH